MLRSYAQSGTMKPAAILALNLFIFWPVYVAFWLVFAIIGPLVIFAAICFNGWQYEDSLVYPSRVIARWSGAFRWMNPIWGNEEDGVDATPTNYTSSNPEWSARFSDDDERIFLWSALRNPSNNFCRFLPWFASWLSWTGPGGIDPGRVRWHRFGRRMLLTWQGPYAGLKFYWFWVGWKLRPEHSDPSWWPADPCWQSIGFCPPRRAP